MTTYLWTPPLFNAIKARLLADTALTDLLGSGTNSIRAQFPSYAQDPAGSTFPLVTFYARTEKNDDAFDGRKLDVLMEFHIYTAGQPSQGGQTLLILEKIKARIMGDWPDHATRVPVFGLDRWIPDFTSQTGDAATDYVALMLTFEDGYDATDFNDGGMREWVMTFKTSLFKRAAG